MKLIKWHLLFLINTGLIRENLPRSQQGNKQKKDQWEKKNRERLKKEQDHNTNIKKKKIIGSKWDKSKIISVEGINWATMYNKYNSRKMLKQRRNIFLDIYFQVRFCTLTLAHVFNYQQNHTHFSPWLFWKLKSHVLEDKNGIYENVCLGSCTWGYPF